MMTHATMQLVVINAVVIMVSFVIDSSVMTWINAMIPFLRKMRNVRTLKNRMNVNVQKHRTTEHNYDVDHNYGDIAKCVNLDSTSLCICRISW